MDPTQTTPGSPGPASLSDFSNEILNPAPEIPDNAGDTTSDDVQQDTADDTPPEAAPGKPARKYRFKNWDEAEDGYLNLQQAMTKKAQEAAEFKKKYEAAEREKKEAARREKIAADVHALAREAAEKRYQALASLDPEEPDYAKKAAGIEAEYQSALDNGRYRIDRETPLPEPEHAETPPEPDNAELVDKIETGLKAAKLDTDDPVFAGFAVRSPEGLDVDQSIKWALDQTNAFYEKLMVKAKQKSSQPLDRSGPEKTNQNTEPEKPVTLSNTLREALYRKK